MKATIKILLNTEPNPRSKLADAELHFEGGVLDGTRLTGFAIWKRQNGEGVMVTVPARQFTVHGERRDFMLLRPAGDSEALARVRHVVREAYEAAVRQPAQAVS